MDSEVLKTGELEERAFARKEVGSKFFRKERGKSSSETLRMIEWP